MISFHHIYHRQIVWFFFVICRLIWTILTRLCTLIVTVQWVWSRAIMWQQPYYMGKFWSANFNCAFLVFMFLYSVSTYNNIDMKCNHVYVSLSLCRYKHVSKTDVKQSWLARPKSAPPKNTKSMTELHPPRPFKALGRDVEERDVTEFSSELTKLGRFTGNNGFLILPRIVLLYTFN